MLSSSSLAGSKGESSFDLKKTISQWDKDQNKKEQLFVIKLILQTIDFSSRFLSCSKTKKQLAIQMKQQANLISGKGVDKSGYRDR